MAGYSNPSLFHLCGLEISRYNLYDGIFIKYMNLSEEIGSFIKPFISDKTQFKNKVSRHL